MDERYLVAEVKVTMRMEDGEQVDDAKNRMFNSLYEGLCVPEGYHIEFEITSAEEV